jgi:hypothetical protein
MIIEDNDKYEISNRGHVRKTETGKECSSKTDKYGFCYVRLGRNTKIQHIHHLVAYAFLKYDPNINTVRHIDGNLLNNKISNLHISSIFQNKIIFYVFG